MNGTDLRVGGQESPVWNQTTGFTLVRYKTKK